MKSASAGLIELLGSGRPFMMADCYTITLASGVTLRYTTFDVSLTYSATTWTAGGPLLKRSRVRSVIGLEVSSMTVQIAANSTDLVGGLTWYQAACAGVLDGAVITLHRAYLETIPTVVGTLHQFLGRVAQVDANRASVEVTCNAPTELLNISMPRNLYQSGCQHTLYDTGCGVVKNSYAVAGTVGASPTRTEISAAIAGVTGRYDLGMVQFTSGVLNGLKRTVKSWNASTQKVLMLNPLPTAPTAGDTFTIWPGCDRTKDTCTSKFSNVANFKGTPYTPAPETAL